MIVAFMFQAGEAPPPAGAGAPADTRAVEKTTAAIPRTNLFMAASRVGWSDRDFGTPAVRAGVLEGLLLISPSVKYPPPPERRRMSAVSAVALSSAALSAAWLLLGSLLRRAVRQIAVLR